MFFKEGAPIPQDAEPGGPEANVESVAELRESADEQAIETLAQYGLAEDLESASVLELEEVAEHLPNVILALTYILGEDGQPTESINNDNRYLVRSLSNHLEAARRQLAAKQFPGPLKAEVTE